MGNAIDRRHFLTGSLAAAATAGLSGTSAARPAKKQEFYEIRIYRSVNAEKKAIIGTYLEKALVPALNRMGIDRVGIFTAMDSEKDPSCFALIPYPTLEAFSGVNPKLAADEAYKKAAADYFALPKKDPAYTRIDSTFFKAFAGMPVIEMPPQTAAKKPRIFELRNYESHHEDAAARKVEMFNDAGETQLMRDVKMGPVFFGEMLSGANVPSLTYMLSADDMDSHKAHWKAFVDSAEWKRMKVLPRYKDTVSKITKWFLVPAACSQI